MQIDRRLVWHGAPYLYCGPKLSASLPCKDPNDWMYITIKIPIECQKILIKIIIVASLSFFHACAVCTFEFQF